MALSNEKLLKHLEVAQKIAEFSKDPSSKVGCRIVTSSGRPVSEGYNGWIQDCDETKMSWERPAKYGTVLHAEENSIIFAEKSLHKCIAIITDAPCNSCLKLMAQARIREIYYGKPDIMKLRGSVEQKDAIRRIIESLPDLKVININTGKPYLEEL